MTVRNQHLHAARRSGRAMGTMGRAKAILVLYFKDLGRTKLAQVVELVNPEPNETAFVFQFLSIHVNGRMISYIFVVTKEDNDWTKSTQINDFIF